MLWRMSAAMEKKSWCPYISCKGDRYSDPNIFSVASSVPFSASECTSNRCECTLNTVMRQYQPIRFDRSSHSRQFDAVSGKLKQSSHMVNASGSRSTTMTMVGSIYISWMPDLDLRQVRFGLMWCT